MLAYAGPGYLVSVGYMDPGNWATNLAGMTAAYSGASHVGEAIIKTDF
jgi:Mn2+/Fe2+ NRAMP family transporter